MRKTAGAELPRISTSSAASVLFRGVPGRYFMGQKRGFVKVPDALSFEEAAPIPSAALTAWNALFEVRDLKPGETVLLQGSGGQRIRAAVHLSAVTSTRPRKSLTRAIPCAECRKSTTLCFGFEGLLNSSSSDWRSSTMRSVALPSFS